MIIAMIAALAFIKKIRAKLIEKLKELQKEMVWSGIIRSIIFTYLKNFVTFCLAYQLIVEGDG